MLPYVLTNFFKLLSLTYYNLGHYPRSSKISSPEVGAQLSHLLTSFDIFSYGNEKRNSSHHTILLT